MKWKALLWADLEPNKKFNGWIKYKDCGHDHPIEANAERCASGLLQRMKKEIPQYEFKVEVVPVHTSPFSEAKSR
jgi:hypothetical protein